MNENKQQHRERQITQDLERASGTYVEFALDGTVRSLKQQDVEVEVKIPSRVEGRFRTTTMKQQQLGEVATYQTLGNLLYGERQRVNSVATKGNWTMDDIPADVQATYRTWAEQHEVTLATKLHEAAEDVLKTPVDRLTATQLCPSCHSADHRYACRTSGWATELYSYPLMRVQDMVTDEVYEVPFDAALYVSEHPLQQVISTEEKIGSDGKLSAIRYVGVRGDTLSAQYVARATDGRIQPKSQVVSIAPDGAHLQSIRIALDDWAEDGAKKDPFGATRNKKDLSAPQIVETLQTMAVREYAERVTDVNYNTILQSVRQALGAKGLTLAFYWHYAGMGENDPSYQALTANRVGVRSWTGLDAHETLIRVARDLNVG